MSKMQTKGKVEPESNIISEVLHRYMKYYGMTSEDIAHKLGCAASNVRYKLNRPVVAWSVEDIILYCNAVNCPLNNMFEAIEKDLKHIPVKGKKSAVA